VTAPLPSYRRSQTVLWRDTGEHVVALLAGGATAPFVLGGGHADLWRLLDQERTFAELVAAFDDASDSPAIDTDIRTALDILLEQGLVEGAA
jgi:hypothetical protein